VAQRASTCFSCGASLADGPRRRKPVIPWPDLVLLGVVALAVAVWWSRPFAPTVTGIQLNGTDRARLTAAVTVTRTPKDTPIPTSTLVPSATSLPPSATPPPAAAAPTAIKHIVAKGETVGAIAEKYDVKTGDIIAANALSTNAFLSVGQELIIPSGGIPPTATPVPTPTGGTLIYRVKDGDTISDIATNLGSRIAWIQEANKLKDTDFLHVGQTLTVPLSPDTPTPTPSLTPTPPPPTPTPAPRRQPPSLLLPAAEAMIFDSNEVLLSWTAVGLLDADEWYRVSIAAMGATDPIPPILTKSTSYRLPATARVPGRSSTEFTWQVQVVSKQTGDTIGAPSEVHYFQWW
jgi:LysM repeat protein